MSGPLPKLLNDAASQFIRDRHLLGAFIGGLVRDSHAAEDLLQEVWVRLAAELEKGTSILNQAAWCRGVAKNLVRRHWEKNQRSIPTADPDSLSLFLDRVEHCFQEAHPDSATDRIAALDQCVDSLPDRSRRLLTLRYHLNADMDSIAAETGLSFEAAKKALIRIRAELMDCVQNRIRGGLWA